MIVYVVYHKFFQEGDIGDPIDSLWLSLKEAEDRVKSKLTEALAISEQTIGMDT